MGKNTKVMPQYPAIYLFSCGRSFFLYLYEVLLPLTYVLWSKLCLDPRVPGNELHDALGNIVRWCTSSLLGSYIHQELI